MFFSEVSKVAWDEITKALLNKKMFQRGLWKESDGPVLTNAQIKDLIEAYGNQRFYDGQEDALRNP